MIPFFQARFLYGALDEITFLNQSRRVRLTNWVRFLTTTTATTATTTATTAATTTEAPQQHNLILRLDESASEFVFEVVQDVGVGQELVLMNPMSTLLGSEVVASAEFVLGCALRRRAMAQFVAGKNLT